MAILILGDPHIGRSLSLGKTGLGSNWNSRLADQLNILEWILEKSEENHVTDIIITGDIFHDTKPSSYIIAIFVGWLKKCSDSNIKVNIISGNHDILRSGIFVSSALDLISEMDIENVFVYKDMSTIFSDNIGITLVPFRDRRSFNTNSVAEAISKLKMSIQFELTEIPNIFKKILIGHLAIEGSIPVGDEIDDLTNEIFCPIDMFSGYDYVWMGHVHKPQILNKKNPYVAHVGSMDLSDFGETDHIKKAIIVDEFSFKEIEIPTRPLKKISIQVPEKVIDTTQYVIEYITSKNIDIKKAIIRLEIVLCGQDLVSVNRSNIEKFLYSNGAFFISKFSESKKIGLVKKQNDSNCQIDQTMSESKVIKSWADLYVEEDLKSDYISFANEIIKECAE